MENYEHLKKLDMHTLRCLCILVTESHVSRAAERLGISQSTMSSVLSELRNVFNDPILVRTSKGMSPTENAISIAEKAHEILDLVHQSLAISRAFEPGSSEFSFKIGASESVGFMFAPQLASAIEETAPKIRICLAPSSGGRLWDTLEEGELDLMIGFQPIAPESFYSSPLYEQALVVIASRQHSRIRNTMDVEQFFNERHVYYAPPGMKSTIEHEVEQKSLELGKKRNFSFDVPSVLATAPIVATTNHLATITRSVANHASKIYDLQVFEHPLNLPNIKVSMFWHSRNHKNSAHQWLRQTIRNLFIDTVN